MQGHTTIESWGEWPRYTANNSHAQMVPRIETLWLLDDELARGNIAQRLMFTSMMCRVHFSTERLACGGDNLVEIGEWSMARLRRPAAIVPGSA